jgi:serine/threonine-protein kinase OSR1/STK39
MSVEAQLASASPPPGTINVQDNMSGPKKFIGAVEDEWIMYSDCAEDYSIGAPIGFGASSIVYAAVYRPISEGIAEEATPCALKVLDLDKLPPRSLHLLQRETTLMSLSKHPNVLRVRGSWMDGHKLYIALRLMNKGSAADVMRYGWPGGMEEDVVRCILRQALKGLNYLHVNEFIHRDIKAANLLIDDDGTVLLGDLGVAADLSEDTTRVNTNHSKFSITSTSAMSQFKSSGVSAHLASSSGKHGVLFEETAPAVTRPKIGKRKSFVGTPCWMAPELIEGRQYDSKADIWSFGITALELTQGRPPRSRESAQRVLLKIIREDPPTLDRDGGSYKYSRAFKEVVDWCLNKDPSKRPTAEELLQTPFFKGGKKKSYLINTILKDLPPLAQRQERRPVPPVGSPSTIDSWDFATTIHSPLAAHRKRISEDHEEPTIDGVFSMEEFQPSTSSTHSRTVSLVEPTIEESSELDLVSPPSPSTSTSSLPSSGLEDGPSSMPSDSTPSSYTESSYLGSSLQLSKSRSTDPKEPSEPLASIAEHASQPPLPNPKQSSTQPVVNSSRRASSSSSSSSLNRAGTAKPNLWQKLRSNSGLDASSQESTPKKKRLGSIFSSNSKGTLSRSSSRA